MVDLGSISSMLASLIAAKDIAHSLIGIRDDAILKEKVLEFQSKILDANEAAFAAQNERLGLLEKVNELQSKLDTQNAWESEASRYELKDFGSETFAYLLKDDMSNGEPIHRVCPTCFQQRRKSVLQFQDKSFQQDVYTCPSCSDEFRFGRKVVPEIQQSTGIY